MTGSPPGAGAALDRAAALCDLQRWDEAVRELRAVLGSRPDDTRALRMMSYAHLRLRAFDEALRWAFTALSQDPDNEHAHRLAALALIGLGRYQEACVAGREAVRIAPASWHGHVVLAQALASTRSRLGEARAEADLAVQLAPHEAEAHRMVGVVATADARSGDAIAAFTRALALRPDDSATHNELGRLALRLSLMGRGAPFGISDGLAEAAKGFATALGTNPRAAESRRNLDLVLAVALGRVAQLVLLVCWIAMLAHGLSDSVWARAVPLLGLLFPAVVALRFTSRLTPPLRALVVEFGRRGANAAVVLGDGTAAVLLLVAPLAPRLTGDLLDVAVVLAAAARLLLWSASFVRSRTGGPSTVSGTQVAQEVALLALMWSAAAEATLSGTGTALGMIAGGGLLALLAAVSGGSGRTRGRGR